MSDFPQMVKITRLGERVQEFSLTNGETVGQMLDRSGFLVAEGETLKVNGVVAERSATLSDGDVITISKGIKGGSR